MTEWITWNPIEELDYEALRGVRLLLWVPPYGITTGHYIEGTWHLHSVLNKEAKPTHWMLPDPPEPSHILEPIFGPPRTQTHKEPNK